MIAGIIALDQFSKNMALLYLNKINTIIVIKNILHLTLVKNSGAALGILKNKNKLLIIIILPLVGILAFYLMTVLHSGGPFLLKISLTFIIGGAIGNLIDRIRLKYVVDFIYFLVKKCPVFNIADLYNIIEAP
jgi:signal peptidase II